MSGVRLWRVDFERPTLYFRCKQPSGTVLESVLSNNLLRIVVIGGSTGKMGTSDLMLPRPPRHDGNM